MKKIFISLFLSGVFMYHTNAQTAVEGNKFLDNWSIGISAGGTTPLTHHSFFGNMRPITGIELNKQLTPVFGFGLEAVGVELVFDDVPFIGLEVFFHGDVFSVVIAVKIRNMRK